MNFIKSIWMAVALLVLGAASSPAQVGPNQTVQLYNGYADTCAAVNQPKITIPVAITTSTTTQLVAAVSGKTVTVCNLRITTAGTTTALTLQTGTGSACATGLASLTGAFLFPIANFYNFGDGQIAKGAVGGAVCVLSAGTTGVQGSLTYTQR